MTYTCKHEGCTNEVNSNKGAAAYCPVAQDGEFTHRQQYIATTRIKDNKPPQVAKVTVAVDRRKIAELHLPEHVESDEEEILEIARRAANGRHPLSAMFHDVLAELGILHDKKQLDYGTDGDPFKNVRNSEDFGVAPWVGCMIRANDKMKRIQNFATKGELANESIDDSLKDLAVYSIIALVLLEEERGNV